jgi:hypothetical protein
MKFKKKNESRKYVELAKSEVKIENGKIIILILFMYGNTQIGLIFHNLYALISKNNDLINFSINVHCMISLFHIIMINYLWKYKALPYPDIPENPGIIGDLFLYRPGAYLWYVETIICSLYYLNLNILIIPSIIIFYIINLKSPTDLLNCFNNNKIIKVTMM